MEVGLKGPNVDGAIFVLKNYKIMKFLSFRPWFAEEIPYKTSHPLPDPSL